MRRSSLAIDSFSRMTSGLSVGSGLKRACSTSRSLLLDGAEPAVERRPRHRAAPVGVASQRLLDVAQPLAGTDRVGLRIERLGLDDELFAGRERGLHARRRARPARRVRAAKNASCAARNRPHSSASAPFGAPPAAFHSVISSRKRAVVGPQLVESTSFSASATSSVLRACGLLALLLELGEVHPPAALDRAAGRCQPGPERVVGLAVEPAQALPALDQRAHLLVGMAPVVARGQLLGLGDQRFLDRDRLGAGCGTLLGDLALARGGGIGDHGEPGVERGQVADDGGRRPARCAAWLRTRRPGWDRRRPASPGSRLRLRGLRTCGRSTRGLPRASRPATSRRRARLRGCARRPCRRRRPVRSPRTRLPAAVPRCDATVTRSQVPSTCTASTQGVSDFHLSA